MKEHTKNSKPSNWDKHSNKQKNPSNNKKYEKAGWISLGKGRTKNNKGK